MRYLIMTTGLLMSITTFAQKTTVAADFIRARETLRLGPTTINAVELDTALASLSHQAVPTSMAVRSFVLNWLQTVDAFYRDADSIYLVVGLDTFAVAASGGTEGSGTNNYVTKWQADTLADSQIFDNGTNIGINVTSGLSAKMTIRGISSNSNYLLTLMRLDDLNTLRVQENSEILFGSASSYPSLHVASTSAPLNPSNNNTSLTFKTRYTNNTGIIKAFMIRNQSALTMTSGAFSHHSVSATFSPSTGDAGYNAYISEPVINQTGSASGIVRSFLANPTLTSAPNYRGFETTNTQGMSFYDSGGGESRFTGRVQIGDDSAPDRVLEVTGDLRVTQSVDSAAATHVWVGNSAGDHRRLKKGADIFVSGDSIIVAKSFGYRQLNGELYLTSTSEVDLTWPLALEIEQGLVSVPDDSTFIQVNFTGYIKVELSGGLVADGVSYTGWVAFFLYKNNTYQGSFAQVAKWETNEIKSIHHQHIIPVVPGDKIRYKYQLSTAGTIDFNSPSISITRL